MMNWILVIFRIEPVPAECNTRGLSQSAIENLSTFYRKFIALGQTLGSQTNTVHIPLYSFL